MKPDANQRRCRTLVVEDHAVTHVTMRQVLAASGYDVEAVGTLAEARPRLKEAQCLILDLELPDGHGTDLLREIRAAHLAIRVAIVTGTADPKLLSEAEALQPDALFIKPFRPDDLLAWLGEVAG
ncbi:MAG TPA: response regulator [Tepidisphaeraceae bacterium]|nr:response regulator [Tepidisphaeraceae bacterium]